MPWTRVNILAEGHSEVRFLKDSLVPHLASFQLHISPMLILSSRKHNQRGGLQSYERAKNDIQRLLSSQPDAYVSTMFDLFRLPKDFPGKTACAGLSQVGAQVGLLERALAKDIGSEMFIPYVQLHEFETLLYCDLDVLTPRIAGSAQGVAALQAEVRGIEPEAINGGTATAPSKRLIKHIPSYKRSKKRVGGPAAAAIPLRLLRERCPHFGAWLEALETIGTPHVGSDSLELGDVLGGDGRFDKD